LIVVGEPGASGASVDCVWIERRPAYKTRSAQASVLASHGDIVVVADADLPATDDQLDRIVGALDGCDAAFGNRWLPAARGMRDGSRPRSVASRTSRSSSARCSTRQTSIRSAA
jgi:hypothetical protein